MDIKFFRENINLIRENLNKRYIDIDLDKIIELEQKYRELITQEQVLLATRNRQSVQKIEQSEDIVDYKKLLQEIKTHKIPLEKTLQDALACIPNILQEDVPLGRSDADNKVLSYHGRLPTISSPLHHEEIGQLCNGLNRKCATEMSGSRFIILQNVLARLERGLSNFFLDANVEAGYEEVTVPCIVKSSALYNSGQLPKFRYDAYVLQSDPEQEYLIATSEIPLINLVANKTLTKLPLKYTTVSSCFRKESGALGKDTKGLIRLHQFKKGELVCICAPEYSVMEQKNMLEHACSLLDKLALPYRIVEICSADTGFCAAKQFDIEVWMPGTNSYKEIASCSNCSNFQAMRMKTKYVHDGKKIYVHTLNCSSLPIGRSIAAILENYYSPEEKCVNIPKVLHKYLPFTKIAL